MTKYFKHGNLILNIKGFRTIELVHPPYSGHPHILITYIDGHTERLYQVEDTTPEDSFKRIWEAL